MILSTAIAHTQTEQTRSPSITPLTIQCACMKSVIKERSEEVSGKADCATSFMDPPFPDTRGNAPHAANRSHETQPASEPPRPCAHKRSRPVRRVQRQTCLNLGDLPVRRGAS